VQSSKLSIAFSLLTILLAATPVLAIVDGAFAQHAIVFAAAIILSLAAMAGQGEIDTATRLLKRFSLVMLYPVFWMVLQAVPLPFAALVNPIWSTTEIALNDPSLSGHISLDPGATLRTLISYFTLLSVVISTVIVTKDRHRAETTLFVLCAVTTFMSAEVLIDQLHSFSGVIPAAGTAAAAPFAAAAALAALVNAAVIARAIERHLSKPDISRISGPLWFGLFSGVCGIAIALASMRALSQDNLFAATVLGFLVMLFVTAVRRFGFRPWPSAVLFTILLTMAVAAAFPSFKAGFAAGLLEFVSGRSSVDTMVARRALSDTTWVGSGAGTFRSLSRAYLDFGVAPALNPPSTAVSIAIEWGRPALFILVAAAAQLFLFTLRGAVRRGRDSFFASTATAAVLVVLCESFIDASLLSLPVQIIIAVIIGLGLSQSSGRTSRRVG